MKNFFSTKFLLKQILVLSFFLLFIEGFSRIVISRREFSGLGTIELANKVNRYIKVKRKYTPELLNKVTCMHKLINKEEYYSYEENKEIIDFLREKYEKEFSNFVRTAKDITGNQLVVIFLPTARNRNKHNKFFERITEKYDVRFINFSEILNERGDYEDWSLYPENEHLSKFGNKIIAKKLFSVIQEDLPRNLFSEKIDYSKKNIKGGLPSNLFDINNKLRNMPYRVITNSLGFRNEAEFTNHPLVTVYGDSFTFGPYLPNHDTYPLLLQRMLRKYKGEGYKKIHVANAGLSGTTIFHQNQILNNSKDLKPKYIILQVLDNDIYNSSAVYLKLAYSKFKMDKRFLVENDVEKRTIDKCKLD